MGEYLDEGPCDVIGNRLEYFDSFSIVIACDLELRSLVKLGEYLWEKGEKYVCVDVCVCM